MTWIIKAINVTNFRDDNGSSHTNLLIKNSHGRYNKSRAIELKELASNSVGINNYALSIQIKMTIELIELLESQIKDIEKQVRDFIKKNDNVITSSKLNLTLCFNI